MTYDKLGKELKKMQKQYTKKDYEYEVLTEAIMAISGTQTLIDMLDADYAELARYTQWTPVEMLLPSEDGTYLVTTENDCGTRKMQVSTFTRYDDIGYSWGIETSPIYTVKAWAELPPMWEE